MQLDGAALISLVLVTPWALLLSATDIRHRRIPVRLQIAGTTVVAVAVTTSAVLSTAGDEVLRLAAVGAVGLASLYFVLRIIAPRHLGGGDLRIAPAVGALGGLGGVDGIALVCIGPFAVTAVVGSVLLIGGGVRHVPHGPAMVCCGLLAIAHGG